MTAIMLYVGDWSFLPAPDHWLLSTFRTSGLHFWMRTREGLIKFAGVPSAAKAVRFPFTGGLKAAPSHERLNQSFPYELSREWQRAVRWRGSLPSSPL